MVQKPTVITRGIWSSACLPSRRSVFNLPLTAMPYLRRECDQVTRLPRHRHEILMVRQILAVREIGGALRALARRDHLMEALRIHPSRPRFQTLRGLGDLWDTAPRNWGPCARITTIDSYESRDPSGCVRARASRDASPRPVRDVCLSRRKRPQACRGKRRCPESGHTHR